MVNAKGTRVPRRVNGPPAITDKKQRDAFVRAHQQQPVRAAVAAPPKVLPNARRPAETPDEFRAAAARARAVQAEVVETNKRRALFKEVDADGSGSLDLDEVKALLGLETNAEAQAVIDELDVDGDGLLDFSELSEAVLKRATGARAPEDGASPDASAHERARLAARAAAVHARKAQAEALKEIEEIKQRNRQQASPRAPVRKPGPPTGKAPTAIQSAVVPEWSLTGGGAEVRRS